MNNKKQKMNELDKIITICMYLGTIIYGAVRYFYGYESLDKTINYMGLMTLALLLSSQIVKRLDKRKGKQLAIKNSE